MLRTFAAPGPVPVAAPALADPLPSWNDNPTKAAIVASAGDPPSDGCIPERDRLAVFDDGARPSEQPAYFQALHALDRQRKAAAAPAVLTSGAMRPAAAGDLTGPMATGLPGVLAVANVSRAGATVEAVEADARERRTTRDPTSGCLTSAGDRAMLEEAAAGAGPRLGLVVHYTGAGREFAHDRDNRFGEPAQGLDATGAHDRLVAAGRSRVWAGGRHAR